MISILVESEEEPWAVNGQRRWTDMGHLMLKPSEVEELEVSTLRDAFAIHASLYDHEVDTAAVVYDGGDEGFFDVDAPYHQVEFVLHEDQVALRMDLLPEWPDGDDFEPLRTRLWSTVEAFASSRGAAVVSLGDEDQAFRDSGVPGLAILTMIVAVPAQVVRLKHAFALGCDVANLVDALVAETPTRDTMADLIRGGNAHLLVGQPEGNWLDVKSQEWDLSSGHGKHRLAIEVAAFCNAEEGGIIVFGARTATPVRGGGEIITEVSGLHEVRTPPRTYMQILSDKVVPLPFGLRVTEILLPGGSPIVMVDIPRQPEELMPFLVRGGVSVDESKIESAAFTVVQRRGEDTVHLDAAMLHSQLAAGRAFLRGAGNRG
ncbi:hypothetical protein ASE14_00165 [Agromyces sp. Root81]|uniref:AlbA family DNA-binding domain-containing protein n=1 Tax=Agromyces sp. Root81 TaxID=1736601 RepID=UPI0006F9E061|nr:ATP-binding protein [Agromyces sp. Root81]KRC62307.1 hypothetical protein ASE14_00165 [Agromyces sp. Root81]